MSTISTLQVGQPIHLPSGEVAEVASLPGGDFVVAWWGSEADYRADHAEVGDWYDRSTASVVVSTIDEASAELGA